MHGSSEPTLAGVPADADLAELRGRLLEVIATLGLREFDEPVTLASGATSRHFIDGKVACASGPNLALACTTMWAIARERGVTVDAVGGLTLGADHFSHGIALLAGIDWFTVRKQAKGRGTDQRIEGRPIGPGDRVLLVDDVVTTGGSIRQAYEVVQGLGAEVVLATTLVDRGGTARAFFAEQDVAYEPVFTSADLGIPPVAPT